MDLQIKKMTKMNFKEFRKAKVWVLLHLVLTECSEIASNGLDIALNMLHLVDPENMVM